MKLAINTTTAATFPGLTLGDIKQQLRILHDDDDAALADIGAEAVDYVERMTGWYFATRTLTVSLPRFPVCELELPIVPVTAVNSIKYYDAENTDTTWADTEYFTSLNDASPSSVLPGYGKIWPSTYVRPDSVRIELVAGYTTAASVPPVLRRAAKAKTAQLYRWRGDEAASKRTDEMIRQMMSAAGWGFYAGAMA